MRKRLVVVVGLLMALGLTASAAFAQNDWGPIPPHGHVMLIGFEIVDVDLGAGTAVIEFDTCVELAAGKALPKANHHHTVHQGTAGLALAEAGNRVVPLAPLTPFEGCDDFESGMTVPLPPSEE